MSRSKSKPNNNNYKKNNNKSRGRKFQNHNYQDAAEEKEYNKGFNAGKQRNSKIGGNKFPVETGSSDNDPGWYIVNGQMAKDVLSLPMDISAGFPLKVNDVTFGTGSVTKSNADQIELPGVLTFNVMPTIPSGDLQTSAVNVSAGSLYQAVQAANSRTPSYEASDLMMYFIALSQMLSYYQWMVRVYGVMSNYSITDRYTPNAIVQAMGADFTNIRSNMADFRAGINQLAAGMASLYLPKSIDYCNRQIFLYETIYRDSTSNKAQYYMYNPVGFYKWVEGTVDSEGNPQLTHLEFVPLRSANTLMTVVNMLSYGRTLLNSLRSSEDIRMMGADMINAFGVGSMYNVLPIAETFKVDPVYNREVLMQMENAYVYPGIAPGNTIQAQVTQDPAINKGTIQSTLMYEPYENQMLTNGSNTTFYFPSNYILNFHDDNVTPEMMLVASRFTKVDPMTFTYGTKNLIQIKPTTTEVILGMRITYYSTSSSPESTTSVTLATDMVVKGTFAGQQWLDIMAVLSRFDWNPKVRIIGFTSSGVTPNLVSQYFFDVDNFTVISNDLLEKVNYMALLGLFTPKSLSNAIGLK